MNNVTTVTIMAPGSGDGYNPYAATVSAKLAPKRRGYSYFPEGMGAPGKCLSPGALVTI